MNFLDYASRVTRHDSNVSRETERWIFYETQCGSPYGR